MCLRIGLLYNGPGSWRSTGERSIMEYSFEVLSIFFSFSEFLLSGLSIDIPRRVRVALWMRFKMKQIILIVGTIVGLLYFRTDRYCKVHRFILI